MLIYFEWGSNLIITQPHPEFLDIVILFIYAATIWAQHFIENSKQNKKQHCQVQVLQLTTVSQSVTVNLTINSMLHVVLGPTRRSFSIFTAGAIVQKVRSHIIEEWSTMDMNRKWTKSRVKLCDIARVKRETLSSFISPAFFSRLESLKFYKLCNKGVLIVLPCNTRASHDDHRANTKGVLTVL